MKAARVADLVGILFYALAAFCAVMAFLSRGSQDRERDALAGRLAARDSAVAQLQRQVVGLEQQKRKADTVRVVLRAAADTSQVRYQRLREVVKVTDTVEVVRVLEAADTAVSRCQRALGACEVALAARDTLLAVHLERERILEAQLEEVRRQAGKRGPPLLAVFVAGALVGAAVGGH